MHAVKAIVEDGSVTLQEPLNIEGRVEAIPFGQPVVELRRVALELRQGDPEPELGVGTWLARKQSHVQEGTGPAWDTRNR